MSNSSGQQHTDKAIRSASWEEEYAPNAILQREMLNLILGCWGPPRGRATVQEAGCGHMDPVIEPILKEGRHRKKGVKDRTLGLILFLVWCEKRVQKEHLGEGGRIQKRWLKYSTVFI